MASKRPRGLWTQPYRAKIPGSTEAAKVWAYFDQVDLLFSAYPELRGYFVGVLPHGFSTEFTPDRFALWEAAASARGLAAGAAFGISSTTDAAGIGQRIGAVAAAPGCALVQLDAEGSAWEAAGAGAACTALCQGVLSKAPRAVLYNQGWPVITSHAGYPVPQFNQFCCAFSEQRYYNDWSGVTRYRVNEPWFNQSWGEEQKRVTGPNTSRVLPHAPTFQGYGWSDIVPSLVTCLSQYDAICAAVWSEWWPEASFWYGARCVAQLHARGYAGPSAVFDFQADDPALQIDGICGPKTQEALGVMPAVSDGTLLKSFAAPLLLPSIDPDQDRGEATDARAERQAWELARASRRALRGGP
jgi:hypothetical protein